MSANRKVQTFAAAAILSLPISTTAVAQQCASLLKGRPGPAIETLEDGQLLQLAKGVWKELPSGTTIESPGKTLRLFYVVRDLPQQTRSGALIFKTARTRTVEDNEAPREVQLSRKSRQVDNAHCGVVKRFKTRAVPSESYDTYHDEGRVVAAQKDIDEFHFNYLGRRNGCRLTTDHTPQIFDWRTNRGQYSFDKAVVGNQTFSQLFAWFGPSRAFASSANLQNQRVEVKQYKTIPDASTCIGFTVGVHGKSSFLRINDLEGLSIFGNRYYRSPEREWTLSPLD